MVKGIRVFKMLTVAVLIGSLPTMLVACGGNTSDGDLNSSTTTLSGVVAGDAASAGTVQLRDVSGTRIFAATDTQEGFQFDVSGFAPPFTLRVGLTNGKTLSTVAAGPGVVRVDPISTVAFRASGDDASDSEDRAADSTRQGKFSALMARFREVMAPLFSCYGINDSTAPRDPAWRTLFSEVRFEVDDGAVTVTNRQSGETIFSGRLSAISQGTFSAANLPARCSGTPSPTACAAIAYSAWGTCQADGTQVRTVTSATPAGCDQSAAVLTRSCTTTTTAVLSAVSVSPTSVTGGASATGTVTLTAVAPTGGVVVTLSSSSTSATVPSSVTIAAGAAMATFTVSTTAVSSTATATLTATSGATSRTATLTVNGPAALSCSGCHGTSGPTTGRHTFHIVSQGYACSSCHGAGYSFTARTVNAANHQNGTVDVTISNWNAAARTCGGCHSVGSRTW